MGLGTGALALVGGTVVVVGFLTITTGALVAVQGYNQLSSVGVEALTGFVSAYFNVRIIVPGTTSVALSATIGAGATAQLGAMRINEEIDALEVIGIRRHLLCVDPGHRRRHRGDPAVLHRNHDGLRGCARRHDRHLRSGGGVYDHYFNTFLIPTDLIWSFVQCVAMTLVIMLVHTYYGFTASGGPAGVGEAVGSSGAYLDGDRGVFVLRWFRSPSTGSPATSTWRLSDGNRPGEHRIHPAWWTRSCSWPSACSCGDGVSFAGTFRSYVPVTVASDRSGLVMESNAKVKMHGVEVGRVSQINGRRGTR